MKLLLRSIAFVALAAFASEAHGQNTIWSNNNSASASFEDPSNWNNGIPTAGSDAFIVPDGVGDSGGAFLVREGGALNITIVASASHTSDGLFITNDIGNTLASGSATLTFASGTTYVITGSVGVQNNEALIYSGNLSVAGSVNVGTNGNGAMTLTSGTLDNGSGVLTIGDAKGNTGTFTQSGSTFSTVVTNQFSLGTSGGTGTYTLGGTGANSLILTSGGLVSMGNATFTQNNSSSIVDFSNGTIAEMGVASGDIATYNLQAGTLKMTDAILGLIGGSTATINQSAGTLTATGLFAIGSQGTGNYILSGGSADFQSGFTVGDSVGSTVTQSGSSILTAEGVVTVGNSGIGTYNLQGGSATFNAGLVVGATGTINQTSGTLTIANGQFLDLSAAGASYTLGGNGVLQVGNGGLVGTAGVVALKLAGGTLQVISAGAFTDPLDSTLTGNSTIDAATTPGVTAVTMAGNLSGTGGLTFEGGAATTFQFTGTNTYTGATAVNSGTLDANFADISKSSALNIGANGVVDLTPASGGSAYVGAVSGSGNLNINFTTLGDPLVLRDTSNYTGNVTLGANGTAGGLQVYNGTFNNISDNGTGSGVTIGGGPLIPFPPGTNVPTSGTVNFGTTTYTGPTTINPNFTLNATNLAGPVTNVGSLFALGSGDVTNIGTLGLSKSSPVGSVFNINGSLISTGSDAVIDIRANGASGIADSIVASNTVTIDSTSTIHVTGTGSTTTPIPIVTGATGLTVTPGALPNVTTNSSLLFSATLSLGGQGNDSLELSTFQSAVSAFAMTPNEAAVAVPIDQSIINLGSLPPSQQASINIVLTALNKLTTGAEIASALEQLTPESLQYSRMIAFENSTFLVERMNGVDADLRGSYGGLDTSAISIVTPGFESGLGRSLGSFLASNSAFHQTAPNGVNYYPGEGDSTSSAGSTPSPSSSPSWNSSSQVISDSPNPYLAVQNPSGPETPGFSEFISGDAVLADLNQNQSAVNAPSSKASYTAADATAGVSFRMNSHLAAGVLFDYNHTDAKTDSSGSKTHVDSYSPGLFATYFDHGFYANGLFSFGYNNYSNSREISLLNESASSHPAGQQYVGDLDFGYDFHPDKHWIVGPTLGVTYTHLDIDSFTESGAPGVNLAIQDQSADSLRSRLGGHVIFQTCTSSILLQPNITAMWQHEYLDNGSGITSSFTDFNASPFTIQTAAPSRDSALIGCGLTATLNNSMAFYLNYLADVGASDYFAQSVVGGLKARF